MKGHSFTESDTLPSTSSEGSTEEMSEKKSCSASFLEGLKENILLVLLIVAVGVGMGMGVGLSHLDPPMNDREIMYLNFPGDMLMRMLKMLILPLIVSSLISGVASIEAPGRMGLRGVLYYLSTTVCAVILGLVLVTTIKPGSSGKDDVDREDLQDRVHPVDAILDLIRNMFPDNLVQAAFQMLRTVERPVEIPVENSTNVTIEWRAETGTSEGINVLGLVVFSLALGLVLNRLGEKGKPLLYFFDSLNEATMILVSIVIWYSPIGICFLIAAKVVEMDDLGTVFSQLGLYVATVMAGLGIHGIIILPMIYLVITRKNPIKFFLGALKALLTAFGTSSSSATLPVTFDCLENNLGIDRRVSRFILPIGATINMDGTALYEAVGAIFIAQMNDIPLSAAQIVLISLTSTAVSIGAAGIPQAGMVFMVVVLSAANLPAEDVSLIVAVDWFLDRFRTMINVWGDSLGTGIVAHLSKKELAKWDRKKEEREREEKEQKKEEEQARHAEKTSHTLPTYMHYKEGYMNGGFLPDHDYDMSSTYM